MQIAPEVIEVETLAAEAGLPMSRVLKRAGVASTTHWRWRNSGIEPLTSTIRKLKSTIAEMAVEAA